MKKGPDLPTHVELMLLATRLRPSGLELERIQALVEGPLDWDQFLAVTVHHRVVPLVFENLQRVRLSRMPEPVRESLHERATRNAFAAFEIMRQIQEIDSRFAAAGFSLTTLKGVPLSQLLFGGPNMRQAGDIDVLTVTEQLPEQLELLESMGYQRINPRSRLTPRRMTSYTEYRKDFTLRNPDVGFDLDLHWRLFDNRLHPGNRIIESATHETMTSFGVTTRVLSLEDQFLYVLSHGISDAWMFFKSLTDAAAFLRLMTPEQLDHALARAGSLGLLPQIAGAIQCANYWMGADCTSPRLAGGVGDAIAAHVLRRMQGLLEQHDFLPNRTHVTPVDWLTLETTLVPGVR